MRKSAAALVVFCLVLLGLSIPTVAGAAGSNELYPTAPTATDDSEYAGVGTPLTVDAANGLLANDSGTQLRVVPADTTTPAHGTVTVNADGSFTYTPVDGYAGADRFDYTVTDTAGQTSTATATITVLAPPDAQDEQVTGSINTPITRDAAHGLLADDPGTGLTLTGQTDPMHGTLATNPDGSFTYTPVDGYAGADRFDYTVTDPAGQTSTGTVAISIIDAPVAVGDRAYTGQNATLTASAANGLLSNDEGRDLQVVPGATTAPNHGGAVTVNPDGSYVYTPAVGFTGTETFGYTIVDATGRTAMATVTIEVVAPPTAANDTGMTGVNQALTVDAAHGALHNDSGGLTVTSNTDPSHGAITINTDGSYVYTPTTGYSGPDSVTYTVTDAAAQTATATLQLTVAPRAVNDSASVVTGSVLHGTSVFGNDLGSSLQLVTTGDPSHGTVQFSGGGTYVYRPAAGFSGTDSFAYTATDGTGQTSATVTVTVRPLAVHDTGRTVAGARLEVTAAKGLLANDNGTGLRVSRYTMPTYGTVNMRTDGSYNYLPKAGFSGSDTFTYEAIDANQQAATATVTIRVTPTAVDDLAVTPQNTPLTMDPVHNDTGTGLRLTSVNQPANGKGTVRIVNGLLVYTPAAGYTGTLSFAYTVTDASVQTATATQTVIVRGAVLLGRPDQASTVAGSTVVVHPLVNDPHTSAFIDSSLRLIAPATGALVTRLVIAGEGTYVVDPATGAVRFSPAHGFTGETTPIVYEARDAAGGVHRATITLAVGAAAGTTAPGGSSGGISRVIHGMLPQTGYPLALLGMAGLLLLAGGAALVGVARNRRGRGRHAQ